MNHRTMFRPKLKQLKEQCVSCPFRKGNDAAFDEVVRKLAAAAGQELKGKTLRRRSTFARYQIQEEASTCGDFVCHHTAYDEDMKLKPTDSRRQCPGATAAYVKAGEGS